MKKCLSVASLLVLAGCGSSSPPPVFQPLDYSYLPPIVLKVANLSVTNNFVPTPDETTLDAKNPAPPEATLLTMLNHRLVPSGTPGNGTVTIQQASIDQANGNLSGVMTVDVNLTGADGHSTGFTEASVSASQTVPDDDSEMQGALYGLTKKLMDQMNVQLQYQIQHNIPSWISWNAQGTAPSLTAGAAGAPGAIQSESLNAPTATATAPVPAPDTGAVPAADIGAAPAPLAPATPVTANQAVPSYLPGAGPAALGAPQ